MAILAITILASLNPLEQIKKAHDNNALKDSRKIYDAFHRYYAQKLEYPWGEIVLPQAYTLNDGEAIVYINALIEQKELRKNYFESIKNRDKITIWGRGDNINTGHNVCFQPTSKVFKSKPDTKYNPAGVILPENMCAGSNDDCYWCIK